MNFINHCRLKQHIYLKLKIAPTPYCQCGQVEQRESHILQDCPLLDQLRPEGVTFGRSCGDAWGSC